MMRRAGYWLCSLLLIAGLMLGGLLLAGWLLAAPAFAAPAPVTVRVLAFNDFHGHLNPETDDAGATRGGILALSAHIAALRAGQAASVLISAGDLFGAAPPESALLADEPTVTLMNRIHPDLNVLGNHEFDAGVDELARKIAGGCAQFGPIRPCQRGRFEGMDFPQISANILGPDGKPRYAPYRLLRVGGIKLAFIGATTTETPHITRPGATGDLRFIDEAEAINYWARKLAASEQPDLIVAVLHEGGVVDKNDRAPDCPSMRGRLPDILGALDASVRVVLSAHTHQRYRCERGGRLVTSAGAYGRYVTRIDLRFDPLSHRLQTWQADNEPVGAEGGAADRSMRQALQSVNAYTQALVDRPVAALAAPVSNQAGTDGEIPLGRQVADAFVFSLRANGAQIGFINPGGLRAALEPRGGQLRFGQLLTALPFQGRVVLLDMRGEEIEALLAEQFRPNGNVLLPTSAGLTYRYAKGGVVPGSIRIEGRALVAQAHYRVATTDFLAFGGDGFTTFSRAPRLAEGPLDRDALADWLASRPAPDRTPRLLAVGGGNGS